MSKIIKIPSEIDLNLYKKDLINAPTKFGLPRQIIYCKKCTISNQRPNSTVEFLSKKFKKNPGQNARTLGSGGRFFCFLL